MHVGFLSFSKLKQTNFNLQTTTLRPNSSIIHQLHYAQNERLLTVTFKKGRFKHSGQTKKIEEISLEIYQVIIDSDSIGRAILEILGERKYIKSQKRKRFLLARLFSF